MAYVSNAQASQSMILAVEAWGEPKWIYIQTKVSWIPLLFNDLITCFFASSGLFSRRAEEAAAAAVLIVSFIILLPSLYVTNTVYKSLKGQMILLQDFKV